MLIGTSEETLKEPPDIGIVWRRRCVIDGQDGKTIDLFKFDAHLTWSIRISVRILKQVINDLTNLPGATFNRCGSSQIKVQINALRGQL